MSKKSRLFKALVKEIKRSGNFVPPYYSNPTLSRYKTMCRQYQKTNKLVRKGKITRLFIVFGEEE